MKVEKILYQAHATAMGGRDGRAVSSDGRLDVKLVPPKEMGGTGEGTNPEQLFAAGYAACFLSAMKVVAERRKIALPPETSVEATIGIGPAGSAFGLEADLRVKAPGMKEFDLEEMVQAAHQVCPYSNATRNNIEVRLSVVVG